MMTDPKDRESQEVREGMEIMDTASVVRPSDETRARILAHARAPGIGGRSYGRAASRGRARRVAAAAFAAVALAGLGVVLGIEMDRDLLPFGRAPESSAATSAEPFTLDVGDRFPDFAATDVETGRAVSLSDLEGQVVLLNIWATWCPPCETEMPSMERLYREFAAEGFTVVALSVDQESTSLVRRWVEERELSFTVLHDREGRFEESYQTFGVPESFLIDRDGRLVARELGPRTWDSPGYGGMVRRLVRDGGA